MTPPVRVGAFDGAVVARGPRPHFKVCGITREEDAAAAAACGASAIGLVFWTRSPRAVDVARAQQIVSALPTGVLRVGVFVNALPDVVRRTAAAVPLDVVQLHGDEPAEWADRFVQPVIKAWDGTDASSGGWLDTPPAVVTLLVDAADAERRGGTGRTADWDRAHELARQRAVILAGGLSPANVAAACAAVGPYAVDVSSGVETAPGVKSAAKIAAFAEALRFASDAGAQG